MAKLVVFTVALTHNNKANVATARELACWVWAVGLMAEEA